MHEVHEGIGIDFGDVIAGARIPSDSRGVDIESDYLAVNRFLRVSPVKDSFECVRMLVAERFGERSWVISKWRASVRDKCRVWLRHHRFTEITGIPIIHDRVIFCDSRAEKVVLARALGITHFIDNKLEVLAPMIGVVPHLFLFRPSPLETVQYASAARHVHVVTEWREIVRLIREETQPHTKKP